MPMPGLVGLDVSSTMCTTLVHAQGAIQVLMPATLILASSLRVQSQVRSSTSAVVSGTGTVEMTISIWTAMEKARRRMTSLWWKQRWLRRRGGRLLS